MVENKREEPFTLTQFTINTIDTINNIDNSNIMPKMIKKQRLLYANCIFCHKRIRIRNNATIVHVTKCLMLPIQFNESVQAYIERKYLE
jgi:hypothetical protein